MSPSEQPRAFVRLIDAAVADLERIASKRPSLLRPILKKLLLIERDPEAGRPLLGALVGWRKLTVGDRDWRIVWRVTRDTVGQVEITISEVWAVGARADSEVYDEMQRRIEQCADDPRTMQLKEVIELLGRHTDLPVSEEPVDDPVPPWLRERLFQQVRMPDSEIGKLSGSEAMAIWERHITGGSSP